MSRVDELIAEFSKVIKAPAVEMEPDEYKRYFDFEAPFLGTGQMFVLTSMERPSGTIDFETMYKLGQITSPNCLMELLKMNHDGIKGLYFVSVQEDDDPPAYYLWLRSIYIVPASTPIKEVVDIFKGNFAAIPIMPTQWPEGVDIWSEKEGS